MFNDYKFVVAGCCGSMGARRIGVMINNFNIDPSNIYGYDVSNNSKDRSFDGVNYFVGTGNLDDVENLLRNEDKVVCFICTPPNKHMGYYRLFSEYNCHIFCEASVCPSDRFALLDIYETSKNNNTVVYPSSTLKFKDSIRYIKGIIDDNVIGKPLSYIYRVSQNLKQWHPEQDINSYYVSNVDTSGSREMIPFELSWLVDIFGPIDFDSMCSLVKSRSVIGKNTGINDCYSVIFEHMLDVCNNNYVGANFSVDVYSQKPYRRLYLSCEGGNIEWDWIDNNVSVYINSNDNEFLPEKIVYKEESVSVLNGYSDFSTQKMYVDEVGHFFDCVLGKDVLCNTLSDDNYVLTCLDVIERRTK